jgi:hypothetical protein
MSAWESLGGELPSSAAVSSQANERLDVFARGTDKACWWIWRDGSSWQRWKSLGGNCSRGRR